MYLPRWIVVLLFVTSIGSLSTVMYLLINREPAVLTQAVPQATVIVSSPPVAEQAKQTATSIEADSMLMASAKWASHEEKSLNFKCDYPEAWSVKYENNVLLISDPQSLTKSVTVSRSDKPTRAATIQTIVKSRKDTLEKDSAIKELKESTARIDDAYDGVLLRYVRGDVATQELVFVTKSYVYTVMMVPDAAETEAVFGEIVKSIDII